MNDIHSLKTQSVTSPQRLRPDAAPVADDPFGSDEALDAFLSGWVQSDNSNLETLAQVSAAPTPPPALPSPDDDAARGIEYLVLQNRSLFAKTAPSNAPSRLLMTDDNATFQPTRSDPGIFNDANAWKLFEPGR